MKPFKFFLFICLLAITSCDDSISFVADEVLTLDSFQAESLEPQIAPSEKILIEGQSLSLIKSVHLLSHGHYS